MSSSTGEGLGLSNRIAASDPQREIEAVRRAWYASGRPPKLLTVDEWAAANRRLSGKEAAEPGPWSNDRTPFLTEIMRALSWDSPYRGVTFMKGAQIGGTECGNNFIGSVIDMSPGPMMMVLPTKEIAKLVSKQRLDSLFSETPCLREKIRAKRSRDSGNTMLEKEFPGGILVITGANSPIGLRSMPVSNMVMDELDAFVLSSGDEGDPVFLAARRTSTFPRGKVFRISTPKTMGRSRIAAYYEASDQRRYFVPCPHCGHAHLLSFDNMVWDTRTKGGQLPTWAEIICPDCGAAIQESSKRAMLAEGEWRPTATPEDPKEVGFHLSSLYSPSGWFSWLQAVHMHITAERQNSDEIRQVFTNTVLGLPFAGQVEQPEWRRLYERREDYPVGEAPEGVVFLTAGIDVQRDRLEVEVVGWSRRFENWSIDYQVFDGDTSKALVWSKLYDYVVQSFPHASGGRLKIQTIGVDTGFRTQQAYNFCGRFPQPQWTPAGVYVTAPNTAIPLKGRDDETSIVLSVRRIQHKGKLTPMRLYTIGVSFLKEELYGWLKGVRPTEEEVAEGVMLPPGFCHWPEYGEAWFRGITAERKVTTMNTATGRVKSQWVKDRNVSNEPLDCRIYARAAAAIYGIDTMTESQWERIEPLTQGKPPKTLADVVGRPTQIRSSDPYLNMSR